MSFFSCQPKSLIGTTVLLSFLSGTAIAQNAQARAGDSGGPAQRSENRANWELANRFSAAALRSITYTQSVQPRFLGETDSMYYNWRDHNGSRFMLYVPSPSGGVKKLLFDPNRMAEQLTLLSRKPYDATNLPFQSITFLKNHKGFRFTVDTTRYEWTLATQTLKSLGRPPRDGTPPDDEERSGGGGGGFGGFGGSGGSREYRNFSPDSSVFAFARDHNLFIVDVKKGDTTQISRDGVEFYTFGFRDTTENRRQLNALSGGGGQQMGGGSQDSASTNDMRVRPNVIWSPDSRSLAFVRRDERKVKDLFLVNVLAQPRPALIRYKYAMPGEDNVTQSELWVYRRGDAEIRKVDVRKWKDQTLMDIHWPLNGDRVRLVRRDRTQRAIDFIEIDVASGSVKTLLTDEIEGAALEPKSVRYLKKGGDFLWWSQKSGWGMFYVYGFDGGEKYPLTTGQWNADGIARIDSTTQQVWVTGQGREAGEQLYQTHLYRVNGNGSGFTLLDSGNASHSSTLSPTKRYVYDTYSRIDQPPVSVVRDGLTGRVIAKLEEMDLSKLNELGFKPAESFSVKAADGITELYGNMWKPFDFDSTKRYPIIAYVYPGPQTEGLTTGFSVRQPLMQLAQLGFIVIEAGHRGGSPQRSLAYHRFGYGNMRDYALADKKATIEQLAARHSYIDLDRVGIFGHSGGGFMTAAAMLQPPYNEFFKVGWSESGNHDNNIYNQNWSEWNHGVRVVAANDSSGARGNAQRRGGAGNGGARGQQVVQDSTNYDKVRFEIRVPTNEELAANLKGNLALITGDLDNNVHPGGTIRLANALMRANKRFDYFVYPGEPHGYRGSYSTYNQRMLMEYFAEHLLGDYYRNGAEIR